MEHHFCLLTDKDRMEDMLTQEKYLISVYSSFSPEADCPQLKTVLTDNFNGCVVNQTELFDKMSALGWYPLKAAPKADIDQARQKFREMKQQISAQYANC